VMMSKTLLGALATWFWVVSLAPQWALADEKKSDPPAISGNWAKKEGKLKIEFPEKSVMKIAPHGDSAMGAVVCEYTLSKEGRVKAKVSGFEGNEAAKKHLGEVVPLGTEFSFKWEAKEDSAKVDEMKCEKVESLKSHLEGEYDQKK
jgi:hypothetical protein